MSSLALSPTAAPVNALCEMHVAFEVCLRTRDILRSGRRDCNRQRPAALIETAISGAMGSDSLRRIYVYSVIAASDIPKNLGLKRQWPARDKFK